MVAQGRRGYFFPRTDEEGIYRTLTDYYTEQVFFCVNNEPSTASELALIEMSDVSSWISMFCLCLSARWLD